MKALRSLPHSAVLGAVALLFSGAACAGMFDDEEARKAILDLRSKLSSTDSRLADLADANARVVDQIEKLRKSLLDLNNQLESARTDNAKLRGTQEQLLKDLAEVQRKQADSMQAFDTRLKKFEPQPVSLDGKEFIADPDERRLHDQAMASLRAGEFDKAAAALQSFIGRFPQSGYIESARFWLGNALYGRKDYKEAIAIFKSLVNLSPDHPRAPEALLALANCQFEIKDNRGARRTLDELVKNYPKSEAAAAGKERLAAIKG